ncbi:hypothetical protein M6B38_317600 [Iris pallida]|uniref:Uncharacterized protein n=1 Tax=Iris pallida TaxID=29817 RepID=A0AAX6HE98_IRIPA|nr:hypothetical protein M6B38_317600 [Iris pallida]
MFGTNPGSWPGQGRVLSWMILFLSMCCRVKPVYVSVGEWREYRREESVPSLGFQIHLHHHLE